MKYLKSAKLMFACVVLGLAGCSSKPIVMDITPSLSPGAPKAVDGIPFRVATEHLVAIYKLNDSEDKYDLVATTTQRLADEKRLFAINYSGGPFATNMLKVVQNGDNTLKSVQLTSTDTTDKTIDALTSTLAGKNTAEAAKKTADLTAAKAVLDADKAVRDAQKDLDALSSTASAETRAIYERILASAKEQANAARATAN